MPTNLANPEAIITAVKSHTGLVVLDSANDRCTKLFWLLDRRRRQSSAGGRSERSSGGPSIEWKRQRIKHAVVDSRKLPLRAMPRGGWPTSPPSGQKRAGN